MQAIKNSDDFSRHGYQIIKVLGTNYFGGRVTYLAINNSTGTEVVIKQFQFSRHGAEWSGYQAHLRESSVLKQLSHVSIPSYLATFETFDSICLVQEYKPACSLAVSSGWTLEEVKQIALALLQTLVYLQSFNPPIIHRDIKPANILVERQAEIRVYLVDFGFVHLGDSSVAASSVVKGTLGFMPPEQIYNRTLTTASDLYSVGVTLICLLTGTQEGAVGDLIDDSKIQFRSLVPDLDLHFVSWLEKMTAFSSTARFKNAASALLALEIDRMPSSNLNPGKFQEQQFFQPIEIARVERKDNNFWRSLKNLAFNVFESRSSLSLELEWQTKLIREYAPLQHFKRHLDERVLSEISSKIGNGFDSDIERFLNIRNTWLDRYNQTIEQESAVLTVKRFYHYCRLKPPEIRFISVYSRRLLQQEKLIFDGDIGPSVKEILQSQLWQFQSELWVATKNTLGEELANLGLQASSAELYCDLTKLTEEISTVIALTVEDPPRFAECLELKIHPQLILMDYCKSIGLDYARDVWQTLIGFRDINWIFPYKNMVFICEKPSVNLMLKKSLTELFDDDYPIPPQSYFSAKRDPGQSYLFYRGIGFPYGFVKHPKNWDFKEVFTSDFQYNPVSRSRQEYEILLEVICQVAGHEYIFREFERVEISRWEEHTLYSIEVGIEYSIHLLELVDSLNNTSRLIRVPSEIKGVKRAIVWSMGRIEID